MNRLLERLEEEIAVTSMHYFINKDRYSYKKLVKLINLKDRELKKEKEEIKMVLEMERD